MDFCTSVSCFYLLVCTLLGLFFIFTFASNMVVSASVVMIVKCPTSSSLCYHNSILNCISQYIFFLWLLTQVLEGVIKYRWNALPVEQRDGMKNFISDVIVQVSLTWRKLIHELAQLTLLFLSMLVLIMCPLFHYLPILHSFLATRPHFERSDCMSTNSILY